MVNGLTDLADLLMQNGAVPTHLGKNSQIINQLSYENSGVLFQGLASEKPVSEIIEDYEIYKFYADKGATLLNKMMILERTKTILEDPRIPQNIKSMYGSLEGIKKAEACYALLTQERKSDRYQYSKRGIEGLKFFHILLKDGEIEALSHDQVIKDIIIDKGCLNYF